MPGEQTLETELLRWNEHICLYPNNSQAYVRRGMVNFKLARIAQSLEDFDQAEKLDPRLTPFLWQRGLSYYYAGNFAAGVEQFEIDLTVNPHDVEETLWRYLCMARWQGIDAAQNSFLSVKNDPRPIMGSIYELYRGDCTVENVLAIGKQQDERAGFYAHLYIGLYYEVIQDPEKARQFITEAASSYRLEDYMWYLACVHQQLREWI